MMRSLFGQKLFLALGLALVACHQAANQQPKFDTSAVERGPVVSKVTASGTLSALVTVQVGSQVSGRVQKILVDYNSVVHKGELIAEIDPQLFEANVEQARANLASAKASLNKAEVTARQAKLDLGRQQALVAQKLVAQADADTAQSNYDGDVAAVEGAKASVLQAEANLHQAVVNLKYTSIYSPIDGVVISRSIDVGQTVAASFQSPTLFTIAEDLRKMQVDTSVSEADIGRLVPQQKATFTVDAFPGERFEGTVRQIRNAATTVQNVVTYDVVIDVANPDLKLRPGMTANVEVVSDERPNVLKVSNAAFRFRPPPELLSTKREGKPHGEVAGMTRDGGAHEGGHSSSPDRKVVWVLHDGQPKSVPIKVGISDGKFTEVVSGEIQEGDQVITAYNSPDKKSGAPGGGMMRRPF